MKRVLITGAAGNLGSKLARHLQGRYELRLLDIKQGDNPAIIQADLGQWDTYWTSQFQDVDTVVHLAANPNPTPPWADLIESNMDSVFNVFTAAAQADVRRVVFASSNHAMGQYKDLAEPAVLTTAIPPRPGTRWERNGRRGDSTPYGAMKLMGERMGKCFADAYPLSVIAVRIGWAQHGENTPAQMAPAVEDWFRLMWLSDRDFCQLMERCIETDLGAIRFAVVNGMSNNSGMRWDIEYARQLLGYAPQDDVTQS
ncbi:MAG: NAD(P)-dependent oxidoreductase [Caldilineaceae bacterium]